MKITRQPDAPDVFDELAFAALIQPVRDSIVFGDVTLTEDDVTAQRLTLPAGIVADVGHGAIVVEMQRDRIPGIGRELVATVRTERVGDVLQGVPWPPDITPGAEVTVSCGRDGVRRVTVTVPLPEDEHADCCYGR